MENHEGQGGSYTRNEDGTLTLNERTEQPKPKVETETKPKAAGKVSDKKE